ncbi:MAG: hypothetical protein AAF267_10990 [Deinococcota bacterium]
MSTNVVGPQLTELRTSLLKQAQGGRVASSSFLDPDEAASLEASLRLDNDVQASSSGGISGARRRIVSAFPQHIPEVTPALVAVYVADVHDDDLLRGALRQAGLDEGDLGDVISHDDGLSVILVKNKLAAALEVERVAGQPVTVSEVDLSLLDTKSGKDLHVVVPSLRVDVLGAKAFRVSRSYFSKGVAGGNVSVNGKPAGKSSSANVGDEIYADGLGRVRLVALEGTTKKGNHKVHLQIERSR